MYKKQALLLAGLIVFTGYAADGQKNPKYTQTEALLSLPAVRGELAKRYKFDLAPNVSPTNPLPLKLVSNNGGPNQETLTLYQNLLNQTLEKERQYKDSHFVFYHAFDKEWLLAQDIYFRLFVVLQAPTLIQNFRFLRWAGNACEKDDAKSFLLRTMESMGLVNDNVLDQKLCLLSVNLALFGNVGYDGECTFDFFINHRSNTKISDVIFNSIFEQFKIPKTIYDKYIAQLKALAPKYLDPSPAQELLQVFIPKSLVDTAGYLAWVRGVPGEEDLIAWVRNVGKDDLQSLDDAPRGGPVMDAIVQEFRKEKNANSLYAKIIEGIKNGRYSLSKILTKYTNTPEQIPNISSLQARLVLNDKLLKPEKDIQMYTYDFVPAALKEKYNQELKQIIGDMIKAFQMTVPQASNPPQRQKSTLSPK